MTASAIRERTLQTEAAAAQTKAGNLSQVGYPPSSLPIGMVRTKIPRALGRPSFARIKRAAAA